MSAFRTLSIAALAASFFAFTPKTPAQTAVYATGTSAAFGFSGDAYPNGPTMKPSNMGYVIGAYHNFPSFTRFKAGLDARAIFASGYNGGKAYTGGVRFSWVPNRFPLTPYAEFGGGMVSTQLNQSVCNVSGCSTTTQQVSGGAVLLDAGLDVRITRQLDIRAIDYGTAEGGTRGLTSAAVKFISAGAVFHLGRPRLTSR